MYTADQILYECPVEALSNILGKKWVAVILWTIQDKKIRFGELECLVEGCSKKVLTQQLNMLMENNIVINEKKSEHNTVESTYFLSDAGLALLPLMKEMRNWSDQNLACGKGTHT